MNRLDHIMLTTIAFVLVWACSRYFLPGFLPPQFSFWLLLVAWVGGIFPDFDVDWEPLLGHRSVVTHSAFAANCSDGGLVIAGSTESYGSKGKDVWLLHTDPNSFHIGSEMGKMTLLLWNRTYGGPGNEEAHSVIVCHTGGYGLAGYTESKASASSAASHPYD